MPDRAPLRVLESVLRVAVVLASYLSCGFAPSPLDGLSSMRHARSLMICEIYWNIGLRTDAADPWPDGFRRALRFSQRNRPKCMQCTNYRRWSRHFERR